MNVQEVADKLEIHELLARYARGVDTHDWELWKSVFTEDAVVDYSQSGVLCGSRDEVAAFLAEGFATIPWATHHITNIEVELDGDRAEVRAMFFNPMQLPGMEKESATGGYYFHEMVRTPGGWRSAHLVEQPMWFTNKPELGSS
jgi:3-phenylpropionate/cinnamic acid dioxygenase small subunit